MRKVLLAMAGVGLLGAGVVASNAALAGPTSDQMAAETDIQAPAASAGVSARGQGVIVPGEPMGNPADASNGLAQSRIVGGSQLRQQAP